MKEFQNEHAGQEGPGGPVPSGRTEGVSLSFAPQSFPNVQAGGAPPQEVRQEQAPVPAPAADRRQSFDFHPDPMRAVEPPPMVPAESVMAPSDFAGSKQYILSQFLGDYCLLDSLIGTGTLVRKEGYLYQVGADYIVLYSDGVYTVCDLGSIRYAAFTSPGNRSAAGSSRGGRRGGL